MKGFDESQPSIGRSLNIGLAVVVGVALVGFLLGTRPTAGPEIAPGVTEATTEHREEEAVPSQRYLELRQRLYGPNSRQTSNLDALRAALPKPTAAVGEQTAAERAAALATRTRRRAYDGAPPTVPHRIDEKGVASCLECHRHGIVLEGRVAPAMSHELLPSCTQCHVAALEVDAPVAPAVVVANSFVGQSAAGKGQRAWPGAPPAIPHPTWMRQRCASCHGVTGLPGLRTTHPERRNCAQCHSAESFAPMPQ